MPDLVISLTTIPSRMNQIGPTLRGLLAQKADVAEIRLYIPRQYRRFDFDPATDLPDLPDGVTLCITDEDFGPATKVLPAVRDFAGQDVEILFCDDDQPYRSDWAQRFLDARKNHPGACIVEKGYDLDTRPPGARYHLENRPQPRAIARSGRECFIDWVPDEILILIMTFAVGTLQQWRHTALSSMAFLRCSRHPAAQSSISLKPALTAPLGALTAAQFRRLRTVLRWLPGLRRRVEVTGVVQCVLYEAVLLVVG